MSLVELNGPNEAKEIVADEIIAQEVATSADVMQQIMTARRFPRSIVKFRNTALLHATLDEEVARQCLFALPRGGKVIEGPSIRFAEIMIAAWGNCRVGGGVAAELDRFVVGRGYFWDLESNSAIAMEAQRRITTSKGKRYDDDMIGVTGNAAASIAMRNAALRGIPKALWWGIYLKSKATAVGDIKTIAAKRASAIEAFRPFGVTEAQIFGALQIAGIQDITVEHLAQLAGFLNAIESEDSDPEDIFPRAETKAMRSPLPPGQTNAQNAQTNGASAPSAGDASKAKGSKAHAEGGAKPASPPQPDGDEPSELEVAVANMLADNPSLAEIEALPGMFAQELSDAPPEVAERARKLIADAAAAKGGK